MNKKFLLILILILGFGLRIYHIKSLPAMNADEAAIVYNSYSLIKTGQDEHGNSWPTHFQSFNDWKPGGYFYMILPFIKVFGLDIYAVRLPNVILSSLTILLVYYLVINLFNSWKTAIASSFLLAVSPWHIHFSRGGWESSTATFFMTLGFLFLIKFLKQKSTANLVISAVSFVASLYTYHAMRIVVPLLLLGVLSLNTKTFFQNIKSFLIVGILGVLLISPLIKDFFGPAGFSRAAGVGLLADPGPINRINEQRSSYKNFQGIIPKLIHNKFINYSLVFGENYLKHYDGNFLFLSGDEIQRNKVPETGQLYLFEIITLFVGFIFIAKKPKGWAPILIWLGIAPIPAALTFQSPHALRVQNMVIPLTIISAYGLVNTIGIFKKLKNMRLSAICNLLFCIFIIWNVARYLHMYYVHMSKEYPYSSQYGIEELVLFVADNASRFDKIYVTDRYDQPYILFLFYLKYPPQKFQQNHTLTARDQFGFSTVRDFDKYHFSSIDFENLKPENPKSLIIGTKEEIPQTVKVIKEIYFPNGEVAFRIVAN